METDALTRAHWMGHEGRDIYEQYYQYLIENTPVKPVSVLNYGSPEPEAPEWRVIYASQEVASRLHLSERRSIIHPTTSDPDSVAYPFDTHQDAVWRYTSAEDMSPSLFIRVPNKIAGYILKHNEDSMDFAHMTTAGLAIEAMHNGGIHPSTAEQAYTAAENILRNPRFIAPLAALATTGFAILRSGTVPTVQEGKNPLKQLKFQLKVNDRMRVIRTNTPEPGDIASLAEADFALHPKLRGLLRDALRTQNNRVKSGNLEYWEKQYDLMKRSAGQPGFSRGCPVAAGGTFTLMCAYLADTLAATREAEQAAEDRKARMAEYDREDAYRAWSFA